MSTEKHQGTAKWFSSKKGFGFITPKDGELNGVSEIFVHQSSIQSGGTFRTLRDGQQVEFVLGNDESSRMKAEKVTAPGGGEIKPAGRTSRMKSKKVDNNNNGAGSNRKAIAAKWHDSLNDDVKAALKEAGVNLSSGTMDVSVGEYRIKLGSRGYASAAGASGVLLEGTFESDVEGNVSLSWEHALVMSDDKSCWESSDDPAVAGKYCSSINLKSGAARKVNDGETGATLWGQDAPDPVPMLESNGFKMRRVVLTVAAGGKTK